MAGKLKLSFRHIFALIGVVGLLIVIIVNRHELASFWHVLGTLRWYIVVVVVAIQLTSYWINALYYNSILKILAYDVGIRRLFEAALAANFVNYVVPTAGLAGAGYFSQVLSPDVPRGQAVITQLMRYALSALAVLVMMPIGFLLIIASGNSGHTIVRVTLFSAIGVVILAFLIVAFVQQEHLLRRILNRLLRTFQKFRPAFNGRQKIINLLNEFYVGWRTMVNHKRRMLVPFGWSIVYIIIEVLTFYLAFVAFGKYPDIGVVIMAYLFANIASIFGGVLFSTGTFEIGMVGTLVALGTPLVLAVSVSLVYRVLNLLIGLPLGVYYYRKYLPSKTISTNRSPNTH